MVVKGFARGKGWVMCPLCFECFDLTPARAGGMLSTIDGEVWDVCVDCNAEEWLQFAYRMNA